MKERESWVACCEYCCSPENAGQDVGNTSPIEKTVQTVNGSTSPLDYAQKKARQFERMIEDIRYFLPPATPDDYADFLEAHFARGGKCTESCEIPFSGGFLIAKRDMILPEGLGSKALNVIVPAGLNVAEEQGSCGHNNIGS